MTTSTLEQSSLFNVVSNMIGGLLTNIRLLARNRIGLVGLVGLVLFLLIAFIGPLVIPLDTTVKVDLIYAPPSLAHPLGTDSQGRDLWSQVVHGGRDLLIVAFMAGLISTLIGAALGAFSAVAGGRFDSFLMTLTDVWLTIPRLPLLIVLAGFVRVNNTTTLAVILGLLSWAELLRAVRAQVLSIQQRDFVEAARVLDLGTRHIIFREILPNMMSYIVINFIFAVIAAMYAQTALIFLGLVPMAGTNWGVMINFAWTRGAIFSKDSFWYIMGPVLAIALFQVCLVSLERGLSEVFNPRLRA